MTMFHDRVSAGRALAKKLSAFRKQKDVVVVGLPRGGVVVAAEVAQQIHAPLEIVVSRKLPAEGDTEYAIGAISETGETIWNEEEKKMSRPEYIQQIVQQEHNEALRRLQVYREGLPTRDLKNKIVLLVDDGIATGFTMRAAIAAVRRGQAKRIVVAVPHGAPETLEVVRKEVDEVVALEEPEDYVAVAAFYEQFPQTTDEEVVALMKKQPV